MKFNPREAQRSREPHLHEFLPQPGAVGTPQTLVSTETLPGASEPAADLANPPTRTLLQRVRHWFRTRSEPRITPITDQAGHTWWQAYNPRTQTLQWLDSETEVMLWLDHQREF